MLRLRSAKGALRQWPDDDDIGLADFIYYRDFDKNETLKLDLHMPPESDQRKRRPAIVVIHGGGFTRGSKGDPKLPHGARNFVANDFVVISINYRLSKEMSAVAHGYAAKDALAAVRWLVKNGDAYCIDTKRIGAFDASAGAATTAFRCVVPDEGHSGNPSHPSNITVGVALSAALWPKKWDYINANSKPYLDFRGTADKVVSYYAATENAQRMMTNHIRHSTINDLIPFEGEGHVPTDALEAHRVDVMDFLTKRMDLDGAECPTPTAVV